MTLSWVQFLAGTKDERPRSADKVRNLLNHAIQRSVEPAVPRLYLGQMQRMLGHSKEEITAIEPEKTGLAALFRKKT